MANKAKMRRQSPALYLPESDYIDSTTNFIVLDGKYVEEPQVFAHLQ